jgi:hypothetical protein
MHAVPAGQMVTSTALLIVFMWGLIRLAGRIYSGALLQFGRRNPYVNWSARPRRNERHREPVRAAGGVRQLGWRRAATTRSSGDWCASAADIHRSERLKHTTASAPIDGSLADAR